MFARRRRGWIAGGVLIVLLALVVRFLLPSTSEVHAKILAIKKDASLSLLKQDLAEIQRRSSVLNELVAGEVKDAKELVGYELEDEALRSDIAGSMASYTAIADRLK